MSELPKPIVPLLAWQQQWIEDEARFKLVVGAAQSSGKSFTGSLDMALDRMKPQGASLGIILSASEPQSIEVNQKVKMHTRAWDCKFEDGYFGDTSISEHRIIFPNGKRIIALPANPDTARGYSGDVFLDEFALHRDSKAIWAAMMTRITRGYKCRVSSTLKGLKNKFGQLAKTLGLAEGIAPPVQPMVRQRWHGYWVSAEMAVAQGAPVDLEEMREAIDDEEIWLQEFCNVPMEDDSQYIPLEMILACETGEATLEWDGQMRPGLCAGYDVARRRDGSLIFLGEPVGPLVIVRGVIIMTRLPFAEQKKICQGVAKVIEAGGGRFAMDATGIGMQLGEELSGEFPCVEAVNFATTVETGVEDKQGKPIKVLVKERMAALLKRRCEERLIWLPESVTLRREFQAVKRYVGTSGAVRLDAGRTEKGHADWFWAAALLCAAAEGPPAHIPASEGGLVGSTVMGNVMERVF
jgi:phage FluMu gp28-like protein